MEIGIGTEWKIKHTDVVVAEDGILELHHHTGQYLDEEVFEEQAKTWGAAADGGFRYALVFVNRCRAAPGGRKIIAESPETAKLGGMALVFASKFGSMMVNFFMRVNRPPVPTACFPTEEAARKYLLDLRELNGE